MSIYIGYWEGLKQINSTGRAVYHSGLSVNYQNSLVEKLGKYQVWMARPAIKMMVIADHLRPGNYVNIGE